MQMNSQSNRHGDQGARPPRTRRGLRAIAALAVALSTVAAVLVGGVGNVANAATPQPTCKTGLLPGIVIAKPGQKFTMTCQHLAATHPYLQVELSLLVAVDPAARPLLTGQLESVGGILGVVTALPEINPTSEQIDLSDSSGNLTSTYTIPTSQPTDPNAKCPPPTEQFNSGLIGCAIAMLDLTSGKPVNAGTVLFENQPTGGLFPPDPTVSFSTTRPAKGQTVKVMDAPNAKTFWWVATLASLGALLTGGSPPTQLPVTIKAGGKVPSHVFVTPAKYQNEVFTPPKLQGSFVATHGGRVKVKMSLAAVVEGFGISNQETVTIRVHR